MMQEKTPPVITIDGPSGTGKGTICSLLSQHLGWHQLDSGVIYRLLAWEAMQHTLNLEDPALLTAHAERLNFGFDHQGNIYLNDQVVSQEIRTERCGQVASKISTYSAVRQALLGRQRAFLKAPGLVTDGRDMGTVVFPNAFLKFFLTASLEARVHRRFLQLQRAGLAVDIAEVYAEVKTRDDRDSARAVSPLKPAEDAILIDTTEMKVEAVLKEMLRYLKERA